MLHFLTRILSLLILRIDTFPKNLSEKDELQHQCSDESNSYSGQKAS